MVGREGRGGRLHFSAAAGGEQLLVFGRAVPESRPVRDACDNNKAPVPYAIWPLLLPSLPCVAMLLLLLLLPVSVLRFQVGLPAAPPAGVQHDVDNDNDHKDDPTAGQRHRSTRELFNWRSKTVCKVHFFGENSR